MRSDLSADQVAGFAREISERGTAARVELLIEPLWNGENEQQYLDRAFPGATASGFVFSARQLQTEEIEDRIQDFMDVFGGAQ